MGLLDETHRTLIAEVKAHIPDDVKFRYVSDKLMIRCVDFMEMAVDALVKSCMCDDYVNELCHACEVLKKIS